MRILLVSALASRAGGADVYTEELALGLANRGHSITVVCHGASECVKQACETAIAELPDYDAWRGLWRIAPWLRWRFWQKYLATSTIATPDVMICSKSVCSSALVRRFPGIPLIYLPHSRIEPVEIESVLWPQSSRIRRWLACSIASACERWSLLHATKTVRFTAGNIQDLRQYYRLPEYTRFGVIPASVAEPLSSSPYNASSPLRLLSVGRLVESKNLAFLLEGLSRFSSKAWTLDIVGDGPERRTLERQTKQPGLSDQVRFHGHQNDIAPCYKRAHLFVFPSRLESLGLVVLEAMSHCVPTLSIRADGSRYRNANHEIITSGNNGIVATGESEFLQRLQSCIANPRQLSPLSYQARQTYLERHRPSVALDRWEKLLLQVVANQIRTEAPSKCGPVSHDLQLRTVPATHEA